MTVRQSLWISSAESELERESWDGRGLVLMGTKIAVLRQGSSCSSIMLCCDE